MFESVKFERIIKLLIGVKILISNNLYMQYIPIQVRAIYSGSLYVHSDYMERINLLHRIQYNYQSFSTQLLCYEMPFSLHIGRSIYSWLILIISGLNMADRSFSSRPNSHTTSFR